MDDSLPEWFDAQFPPLAIYHGGRDFLVSAEPLVERMRLREKHVQIIRDERLDDSEVRISFISLAVFINSRTAETCMAFLRP